MMVPGLEALELINDFSRITGLAVQKVRAATALRQAGAVFESTRDGVFITDLDASIVAVNRAFTDITGYTADPVYDGAALARAANAVLPGARLVGLYQIHSPLCVTVREAWEDAERPEADALVTDRPGLLLGILTADCAPVLLADAASFCSISMRLWILPVRGTTYSARRRASVPSW